jgi:hypothetical protein
MASKKLRPSPAQPTPAKRAITIELSEETAAYLDVLRHSAAMGGIGALEDVLLHLAQSAADGVRRPGAWERGWVGQAFGPGWEAHVEPHPTVRHYVIPRKQGAG